MDTDWAFDGTIYAPVTVRDGAAIALSNPEQFWTVDSGSFVSRRVLDLTIEDGSTLKLAIGEKNKAGDGEEPALELRKLETGSEGEFFFSLSLGSAPEEGDRYLIASADTLEVDEGAITIVDAEGSAYEEAYAETEGNKLYAVFGGSDVEYQDIIDDIIADGTDSDDLQEGFNLIISGQPARTVNARETDWTAYNSGTKKIEMYLIFLSEDKKTVTNSFNGNKWNSWLYRGFDSAGNPADAKEGYISRGGAKIIFDSANDTGNTARASDAFEDGNYLVKVSTGENSDEVKIKIGGGGYQRSGSGGCSAGPGAFGTFALLASLGAAALRRRG